jgi:TetR/AcrR family transcriptional repressor of nem operon
MLKHYVANASAFKRRILLSPEPESNPRQRLLTYLESTIAAFMANEGKCPCLVGKLASEVADFSDDMRQVLAEGCKEWAGITEALIREGLKKKLLACPLDPAQTAGLIGDLWTGAMQRASIERRAEPLRATLDFVASTLIPSPKK